MPETKQILTADQYVVKLLGERDEQLTKAQEKYDDLLKRFVKLQVELQKYETLKSKFVCERTTTATGYSISLRNGSIGSSLAYSWELDPNNQSQDFQELLDLLGLELPKGE